MKCLWTSILLVVQISVYTLLTSWTEKEIRDIDSTMVENILVFLYKRLTKTSVSALVELVTLLTCCCLVPADVEDVKFVINFDYPNNSEDYVHRIGRTGRSQATGTAYTFFTPGNAKQANDLISVLQEANQIVAPKLLELADNFRGGRGGGGGGSYNFFLLF